MEESDALVLLGATSSFMRRDLNRVLGYFEATVPLYSLWEFQSHLRLTRVTIEERCREEVNKGRIPLSNRGRERIPPEQQLLIFVWTMANQEMSRLRKKRYTHIPVIAEAECINSCMG